MHPSFALHKALCAKVGLCTNIVQVNGIFYQIKGKSQPDKSLSILPKPQRLPASTPPESGTVLVSHPCESGTVLVSHPCESGTVLAAHPCPLVPPCTRIGTVLISHADQTGTGRLQIRIVGWFLPAIQTSLSLVRAFARIPDIRADGSSTGPRPRPVSGHARGLVERAHPTHRSPRQHLGRGRTSGAGRVAQSEFRGMRGAQARREGGAVRAPAGREFAALPRRSDERPSRE